MTTGNTTVSEWTADGLRPVARWVRGVDERGRSCLLMRWAVPQVVMAAVTGAATSAVPAGSAAHHPAGSPAVPPAGSAAA